MRGVLLVCLLGACSLLSEATFHRQRLLTQPASSVFTPYQPPMMYNLPPGLRYVYLDGVPYAVLGETVRYVPAPGPAVYSAPSPSPLGAVTVSQPVQEESALLEPQTGGTALEPHTAPDAKGSALDVSVASAGADSLQKANDGAAELYAATSTHDDETASGIASVLSEGASSTGSTPPSAESDTGTSYAAATPFPHASPPELPDQPATVATAYLALPAALGAPPADPASGASPQAAQVAEAAPAAASAYVAQVPAVSPPLQPSYAAAPPLGPMAYFAASAGGPPSPSQPVVLSVDNPRVTVTRTVTRYAWRHPPVPVSEPVTVVFSNRDKSPPTQTDGVPFTLTSSSVPTLVRDTFNVPQDSGTVQSVRLLDSAALTPQSSLTAPVPAALQQSVTGRPYSVSALDSSISNDNVAQPFQPEQHAAHLIGYTLAQQPLLKLQIDPTSGKMSYVGADGLQIDLSSKNLDPSAQSLAPSPSASSPYFSAEKGWMKEQGEAQTNAIKENIKLQDMAGLENMYRPITYNSPYLSPSVVNPPFTFAMSTSRNDDASNSPTRQVEADTEYPRQATNTMLAQQQQPRDAETLSRLPVLLKRTYQRLDQSGQADRPLLPLPGFAS